MDEQREKRLALGVLGPKRAQPEFGKSEGFSAFSFENERTRFAFMQDGNKSSFAFASQGKDGSQQAFGFKSSSKDDSFKFKMASTDGNHQFAMNINATGSKQAFSMSMQHGDKGGFAMNLGFDGAKGKSKGPGLALQSGKNGLSMMLDLSGGGKGGNQGSKTGAGMNMSINMGGGKGSSINIGLGSQGGGGFAMSIGFGGKQSGGKK